MKLFFVYNPHAGVGRIRSQLSDIIEIMIQAGYEVSVHPTQAAGDATVVTAERAVGYELVVCCGGDGTLDETVTGLMESGCQVPLGYIPAGSTNDFANSLGIPKDMFTFLTDNIFMVGYIHQILYFYYFLFKYS